MNDMIRVCVGDRVVANAWTLQQLDEAIAGLQAAYKAFTSETPHPVYVKVEMAHAGGLTIEWLS